MNLSLSLSLVGSGLNTGGGASLATIERIGVVGHSWVRLMLQEQSSSIPRFAYTTKAWAAYAAFMSGRKFAIDPAGVEGYSGFRTDQIQAAILPKGSTTQFGPTGQKITIPYGVLSSGVKRALVCALTNDIAYEAAQQGTINPSPAPAITRLRALWAFLRSQGVEPINVSIGPRNDTYSGAVPAWFAAEAAAAAADGVQNIDILTPCSNDGMTWKPGYDWNDGAEDATTLHPGADGCILGIAPAIAAAVVSTKTSVPHLVTATKAEIVRGVQSVQIDALTDTEWDGLFSAQTKWPQYSQTFVPTKTLASGDVAEFGNYLQVAMPVQVSQFYHGFRSETVNLTIGQRYGLMIRTKFDAGKARPAAAGGAADIVNFTLYDAAITNPLVGFSSGGRDSFSLPGASLPSGDIYMEFIAPVSAARLLIEQRTEVGSAGSQARHAQIAIIAL